MKENKSQNLSSFKEIESGKYRSFYLVYNRKSTDEPENQKNSIVYQKSENTRFAYREHLSIAQVSIDGFCVDGIISEKHSAYKEDTDFILGDNGLVQYKIDRPKFAKLVQLLNQGYFKGVIILCWDRISRNKGDESVIRKLIKSGIDFRFVLATYDKSSSGALHMDIDGMFAEHHSRVTSEKVLLNVRNQREKGKYTSKAPVGYLNMGTVDNKPFDPQRAPIVKKMFEFYATGNWSLTDLSKWSINQGFTMPPARRKRTTDEKRKDEDDETFVNAPKLTGLPNYNSIHRILTNTFYIGKIKGNNGEYIKSSSHDPLITEKLFNDVQIRLKNKNVSVQYSDKIEYPLRGKIRCNECKRVYTPYIQKEILYFGSRCKNGCNNKFRSINILQIEIIISKMIFELRFTENELIEINNRSTTSEIKILEAKRKNELDSICREKKKINEDLEYLQNNKLNLLKSGVYSPDEIIQEEAGLKKKLEKLPSNEVMPLFSIDQTLRNAIKLSELLKTLHLYYENASSAEKELIGNIIFSELNLYQKTLIYKCQYGFEVLKNRFVTYGARDDWLSELPYQLTDINMSIQDIETYLNNHSPPS